MTAVSVILSPAQPFSAPTITTEKTGSAIGRAASLRVKNDSEGVGVTQLSSFSFPLFGWDASLLA